MNLDWLINLTDWKIILSLFLSFSAGAVIGVTEIISTFQYRKTILSESAGLTFFYGFAGLTAFILVCLNNPEYWDKPLTGLLTGMASHVILRSRFTLLRSREENGDKKLDVSIDMDNVINKWVKFF